MNLKKKGFCVRCKIKIFNRSKSAIKCKDCSTKEEYDYQKYRNMVNYLFKKHEKRKN